MKAQEERMIDPLVSGRIVNAPPQSGAVQDANMRLERVRDAGE